MAFIATTLGATWAMLERANAAPVQATWRQRIITVDDERAAELAAQWGAPFEVRFVEGSARCDEAASAPVAKGETYQHPKGCTDIVIVSASLSDMAGGEAMKDVRDDRIIGARILAEDTSDVVLLHELGHTFGLHHDNGHSKSLMYWVQGGGSGADGVTEHDSAALAALYAG